MKKSIISLSMVGMCASSLFLGSAAAQTKDGNVSVNGGNVVVMSAGSADRVTLTVTGPDGFSATKYLQNGMPTVSLYDNGFMADGIYHWEITGASREFVQVRKDGLDNGRSRAQRKSLRKPMSASGSFLVVNGVAQMPDPSVKE